MTSLGSKALVTIVYTPIVVAMIHSLYVKLGKNPVEDSNFNAESITETIFSKY